MFSRIQGLFLCLGDDQFDRPIRAGIQADVAIAAAFIVQVWHFSGVGLHDGVQFADLDSDTFLASLAEIGIDADADGTSHIDCAEYTRKDTNRNLLTGGS